MENSVTSSPERSLVGRRVLYKGGVGLIGRGSQGSLLAIAVVYCNSRQASDLAIGLAIAAAVNLFTNVGVPTLIVRHQKTANDRAIVIDLVRAYAALTLLAGVIALASCWLLTAAFSISVLCGALCLTQSAFYGLEYWSISKGPKDYDTYLRRCATLQATGSILSPVVLFLTKSPALGLTVLSASFVLGSLFYRDWRHLPLITLRQSPLQVRRWWRDAVGIGLGSCAAAALYASDVVVLKLTTSPGVIADYRLAIMCIALTVALLPLSIFALADASAGFMFSSRLLLVVSVVYVVGLSAFGWSLDAWGGEPFEVVAQLLKLLAPLAAFRLVTQVVVSELNAHGRQYRVAGSFLAAVGLWALFGMIAAWNTLSPAVYGAAQLMIELSLMIVLLWPWARIRSTQRRTSGRSGGRSGDGSVDQSPDPSP